MILEWLLIEELFGKNIKTWEEYKEFFREQYRVHNDHVPSDDFYLNIMRLDEYFQLEEIAHKSASLAEFISGISGAMCEAGLKLTNDYYERCHHVYNISFTISDSYPHNYPDISLDPEQIAWFYILLNKDRDIGFLDDRDKAVLAKCHQIHPSEISVKKTDTTPEKCMKLIMNARSYYEDPECTVFNWDRALVKNAEGSYVNDSKKTLAEIYAYYMGCSADKAMTETEKALLRLVSPENRARFPGWRVDFNLGKPCMCLKTRELSIEDWISFEHPFFKAHSKDPVWSAVTYFKTYYSSWLHSIHSIYGEEDRVIYEGRRYGEDCGGKEDENTLRLGASESYSYHDGGGGSRSTLKLSFVLDVAGDVQVQTDDCGISCKGWYDVGRRRYLIDPFGMTGVFEFCDNIEEWDIEGDRSVNGIGMD